MNSKHKNIMIIAMIIIIVSGAGYFSYLWIINVQQRAFDLGNEVGANDLAYRQFRNNELVLSNGTAIRVMKLNELCGGQNE